MGEGSVPGRPQRALPDYNLMRIAHLPFSEVEDGGWWKNSALILHPCITDGICVPLPQIPILKP